MIQTQKQNSSIFNVMVIVAALGYFVDIYDLLLFQIVRIPSLLSLGLTEDQADKSGQFIISIQMIGLLVGGIIWGIMADKKGRLSVLFGSIVLYSIANIFNGFVHTVNEYALVRFFAGVGLAGELGAGITLVSELVHKSKRGISTSLVAGLASDELRVQVKRMIDSRAAKGPGDIEKVYANPDKAKRLLGWQTNLKLEDGLRDAWRWQQKLAR